MRSYDLRYFDMLNDDGKREKMMFRFLFVLFKDTPDRSGIFYVKHPQFWSALNIREYFQRWGYPFCEAYDPTIHIVALRLRNETTDTRKNDIFF
jgi:hypothetical protein